MAAKRQSGGKSVAGAKARKPRASARRQAAGALPVAVAAVPDPDEALPRLPADVTREAFSAPALPLPAVETAPSHARHLLEAALRLDRESMPVEEGEAAEILLGRHEAMMTAIWTVWIGFVVIACSGFVLAEWFRSLGVAFGLEKAVLLWLPVAIIAGTGPVWLPLAIWSERRDLRARLAMVTEGSQ